MDTKYGHQIETAIRLLRPESTEGLFEEKCGQLPRLEMLQYAMVQTD